MKTQLMFIVPLAILLDAIPAYMHAQSYWSLTVNFYNVPFGEEQIFLEAKGPFGADVCNQLNAFLNHVNADETHTH